MRYQREEPFRFTFDKPIAALFQIKGIDGHPVDASDGEANIIDISTEGIKLNSKLDIPDSKSIQLSISFELNSKELNVEGFIVWKKNKGVSNDYGLELETEDSDQKELVKQLKIYAKKLLENG